MMQANLFSEKRCTKCGEVKTVGMFSKEKRSVDGVRSQCKACISADMAIYTKANKNKKRLYDQEYRQKNAEKLQKDKKVWREENKEKLSIYRQIHKQHRADTFKEYCAKNAKLLKEKRAEKYYQDPEKFRKRATDYRRSHPEKLKEYNRNNKHKLHAHYHKRRARKIAAGGHYSGDDILNLLKRQKNKCLVCKTDISKKYHIDHVMPLALGGTNFITDIQLLCPFCNLSKGAKHPIEFMQSRGFLL